jgi:hypothetical protein
VTDLAGLMFRRAIEARLRGDLIAAEVFEAASIRAEAEAEVEVEPQPKRRPIGSADAGKGAAPPARPIYETDAAWGLDSLPRG